MVSCPEASTSIAGSTSPSATSGSRVSWSSVSADGSSAPSTYALRKPWKVITRPDEVNSQFSPVEALASILIETLRPSASFIWDAIVRIQISS